MTWLSDTIPNAPYDLTAETVNGIFQLKWNNGNTERATYTIYKSVDEDFDINNATKIIATGVRQPMYEMYVENNDEAYYYFVTTSDAYNNESVICHPALYYHSDTIK
jgi:hypothetical protein